METIIEFGGDSAVHASAGTGKTWLLVEKFLHELKTPVEGHFARVESIAAITFTEKAADEMRQRIAQRIFEETAKLSAAPPDADTAALIRHLVASRRRMARAYISTIHSFCARVLRENPVEAGIDPHFQIMDERRASGLLNDALRQFLLQKLRRHDRAVMDLVHRYGFIGGGRGSSSITSLIAQLLPLLRASGLGRDELLAPYASFLPAYAAERERRIDEIAAAISALRAAAPEAVRDMLDTAAETAERIAELAEKHPDEALRLAKRGAAGIKANISRKAADELKAIRAGFETLEQLIAGFLSYEQVCAAADLLNEFRHHYQTKVKNRGLLDFDDLEEMTIHLFKHNPEIRETYRRNFRKLLVDEFQDVNHIQKELIYQLAAPGEGKLFVVGDPKQAIYGFRGGDVEVFEETKAGIQAAGGKIFYLRTNRRSVKELVDFVNEGAVQGGNAPFTPDDLCESLRPAAGAAAVELHLAPVEGAADENRWMEARRIAGRIRRMVREGRTHYRDIVILFRKFTALPLYESVFRAYGIPLAVHKGAGFYQSQEVQDLISLLAYIEDPGDMVSWAAAVRSPFAGCSDETLLSLRVENGGIADPLEREKYLRFEEWSGRIRRKKDRMTLAETIEAALQESGITGILGAQPHGLQKVANVQKLIEIARDVESAGTAGLKQFTREMLAMIDEGGTEAQAVIAGPDMDVVRVMTIHQSKGLEFPIVFVPDITAAARGWPSPAAFHLRKGLAMKYMDKRLLTTHQGTVYRKMEEVMREKEERDEQRLFYVACTRACDLLVLTGGLKNKPSPRALALLETKERLKDAVAAGLLGEEAPPPPLPERCAFDVLAENPPEAADEPAGGHANTPRNARGGLVRLAVGQFPLFRKCKRLYLFQRLHHLSPLAPTVKGKTKKTPAIEAGTAVHSLIESLDLFAGEGAFRTSVEKNAGVHLSRLDKPAREEAKRAVIKLPSLPPLRQMRDEGERSVGKEIPFTFGYGRGNERYLLTGTIDALVLTRAGNVHILDYKFSRKPGDEGLRAAELQLNLYALAAARALPAGEIRCTLIYLRQAAPEAHTWTVARSDLPRLEAELAEDTERIIAFEERAGNEPDAASQEEDCPDARCAFREFCG